MKKSNVMIGLIGLIYYSLFLFHSFKAEYRRDIFLYLSVCYIGADKYKNMSLHSYKAFRSFHYFTGNR